MPLAEKGKGNTGEKTEASLCGVGGWLLLFCVGLTILTPLAALLSVLNRPSPLNTLLNVSAAGFSIYVGAALWHIRSNALKLVKAYFIAVSVLVSVEIVLSIAEAAPKIAGRGIAGLISVAMWWAYFRKSRRVKATFGSNLGEPAVTVPLDRPEEQPAPSPQDSACGATQPPIPTSQDSPQGQAASPPSDSTPAPVPPAIPTSASAPTPATVRQPAMEKMPPSQSEMAAPGSSATATKVYKPSKINLTAVAVIIAVGAGVALLVPLTRYKYMKEGNIQFRYDRYSGRTDRLFASGGWEVVGFDRPPEDIPTDKIFLGDGQWRNSPGYDPSTRINSGTITFTVLNKSEYVVKSITINVCPAKSGCSAVPTVGLFLAQRVTLRDVSGFPLDKGREDKYMEGEWKGPSHAYSILQSEGWTYEVVGARGWKR